MDFVFWILEVHYVKKVIFMLCLYAMLSGTAAFAQGAAQMPADLAKTHWIYDSAKTASEDGWLILPEASRLKPDSPASRKFVAQLLTSAWATAQKEGRAVGVLPDAGECSMVFSDMGRTDEESQQALKQLVAAGVLSGYPKGVIEPDKPVTRLEMAVLLSRASKENTGKSLWFSDQTRIPQWGTAYVDRASSLGFISGYPDGRFWPEKTVTYAEALQMITQWAYPKRAAVVVSRGQASITDPLAADILRIINRERSEKGLAPLDTDHRLTLLALDKSRDMAENHYFAHTSLEGEDVKELFERYDIVNLSVGENLLKIRGTVTPEKAVATWMQSDHHRDIILTPYTDTGIGIARGSDGTVYITQAFASF